MPDGTVYAGISPETGKAMFTTAADAPATCTFNEAQDYAANLEAYGHRDWRVPTLLKVSHVAAAPLLSPLGTSWPRCSRIARSSVGSRNPVRISAAGTGRLRSTTTTRRGSALLRWETVLPQPQEHRLVCALCSLSSCASRPAHPAERDDLLNSAPSPVPQSGTDLFRYTPSRVGRGESLESRPSRSRD